MTWYFTLDFLAIAGGVYAFINFRKISLAFKWLGVYLFTAGVIQFFGLIMIQYCEMNNSLLYNIATFVYHFILFMFFLRLSTRKRLANLIKIFFLVSAVLMLYIVLNQIHRNWFSISAQVVQNFVLSITAMLFLLNIIRSSKAENPLKSSTFIALVGILFYFSTSTVYYIALQLSVGKVSPGLLRWFNIALIHVFYLILILAMYREVKQKYIHGVQ